jgi:hypothetical protein
MIFPSLAKAQECAGLTAKITPYESRCAATGAIKVIASGGSGSYKYKVTGPVNINFTSADSITGLSSGIYNVIVNDIVSNCTYTELNVVVTGSYKDPRFTLNTFDVTCDNGNNGSISLNSLTFGRDPFMYSIVAPSPMGVGVTNNTGTFNNLIGGIYTIKLTDSCGGIQTRLVTINNYTWKIDSFSFKKISCDTAKGSITVSDSKGNISTVGGLPGFIYGIVRNVGDTIWSTNPQFSFYLAGQSNFEVIVKDPCGKIKKVPTTVSFKPTVAANVNMYNVTCSSFSAAVTGVHNFFGAQFCLFDSSNKKISCNATGIFTNLPFGNYCIKAQDSCSDTVITRCFNRIPPPISIGNTVAMLNRTCNTFSAAIIGQVGLTSPSYCLSDDLGNIIVCNSTGIFNNLSYKTYCISVIDGCRDTTIKRCFTARKPIPVIPAIILPAYAYCQVFGVIVKGDSLTSPLYCLYDVNGVQLTCNTTGKFDSIAYGNYCITIHDSCYDTTIVRCISILAPTILNDIKINVNNRTCASFSANVSSNTLIEPSYCLYNSLGNLLVCNTTGIFNNLTYGSYCIKARNKCPDSTFTHCFKATPPLPSLNSNVIISNKTCNTFNVNTTGEQNFTNPKYCLFNAANIRITCNTTGIFSNLTYGNYCIRIKDGCYDTLISRCFNVLPTATKISVIARKSCALGFARFIVVINAGKTPVNVKMYDATGNLFINRTYSSTFIVLDSIPATLIGQTHKIVVTDFCGRKDSVLASAVPSTFTRTPAVVQRCPSSNWANGSGSIITTAISNTSSVTVRIIKRNNIALSPLITPSLVAGNSFTFNNLEPAKYIVEYKTNDACSNYLYDTLTVKPYLFPNLNRSSAYQCDLNGFSIGAIVSNGVGPFLYEIIGSSPTSPSIITQAQPSPLFNINNGTNYSLVRLRVNDACGNASLGDASILPLANNGITASFNCFQLQTTLKVDTMLSASYSWYQKRTFSNIDSIFIGTGSSIYIPNVMPADTGYYVCNISLNAGCIKRRYFFHLNGRCADILPVSLQNFKGKYVGKKVLLDWQIAAYVNLKQFVIERKNYAGAFEEIGMVMVSPQNQLFNFWDSTSTLDKNFYRIKLINYNNTTAYSKVVMVNRKTALDEIQIYPNPAADNITIEFKNATSSSYNIRMMNLLSQVVKDIDYDVKSGNILQITRTAAMRSGIYILQVYDKKNSAVFSQKIIFQ